MVEWCIQNLLQNGSISRGTSHATTKERYQYTTSVDINNTRYKRMQSLIQNHMQHVRSESAREQRTALYKSYIFHSYIKAMNNNNNNKKKNYL